MTSDFKHGNCVYGVAGRASAGDTGRILVYLFQRRRGGGTTGHSWLQYLSLGKRVGYLFEIGAMETASRYG